MLKKFWRHVFGPNPTQADIHPSLRAGADARVLAPNAIKPKATRHKKLPCGHCVADCQGKTAHLSRSTCRICVTIAQLAAAALAPTGLAAKVISVADALRPTQRGTTSRRRRDR